MKKKSVAFSFIISIILFLIIAVFRGLYPFGKNTLFVFDMSQQYVEFLGYLKHVIFGVDSWNYSFVQSLGGDSVGLFAYYLMSPYNLLLLLFGDNLVLGVFTITALKIASAATTMTILLNHRNHGYAVIPFAVSYAFMGYVIIYSSNIMWLDGIIVFPLVVLGLMKMLEEKRTSFIFIFALCYSLITNFYMGYIICIALVLFFVCWQVRYCKSRRILMKDILLFACNSILGAGTGAVLLIPFAIAMTGTKSDISIRNMFTLERIHTIKDCLVKLYPSSWITVDVLQGAPIIYCGIAMMLLAAIFIFNKKINNRAKVSALILMLVFAVSSISKSADLIWHVFNTPTCYPGRYAFLISFFIICMAFESYQNIDNKSIVPFIIVALIYVIFAIIFKNDERIALIPIIIMAIVSAVIVLIHILSISKPVYVRNIAVAVFTLAVCADCVYQAKTELAYLPYDNVDDFNQYYSSTNEVIQHVKKEDDSFYRMEKTFLRGYGEKVYNDSYLFDYNGISSFSSTTKDDLKSFMGRLGYRQNFLKIVYGDGSTEFVDSLLGIKYILTEDSETGIKKINENENAAGIVTADMSATVKARDLNNLDTFEYQNELCHLLRQDDADILQKIDVVDKQQICDNGVTKINYKFKPLHEGYVYFRIQGNVGTAGVRVNGEELREYYVQNQWNIGRIYVNDCSGDVNVNIEVDSEQCNLDELTFYQQNDDVFESTMNMLKQKAVSVTKKGSNSLSFDTVISEDGNWVLLTIPFDSNWKCYVDGKKVSMEEVYGGFTAITMKKGKHHVELKYPVRGVKSGLVISIVSFIVLANIVVIRTKNKGDKGGE